MTKTSTNILQNSTSDETGRLLESIKDTLTDSMVERFAITGTNVLDVADRLNDDATRQAVHAALDKLTELHRTGAMDTVFEVVALLHAVRQSSSDQIVERLFSFAEQLLSLASNPELAALLSNAQGSLVEAATESKNAPATGGLFSSISLLTKPETQQSLRFLVAFAGKMQQNVAK